MTDAVNHPQHYTEHPSGVECITVVEHMGFNLGNAVKYIWRAGLKSPDAVEDLRKARWYSTARSAGSPPKAGKGKLMPAITFKLELPTWQRLSMRLRMTRRRRDHRSRNADKLRAIATLERGLSGENVSIRETFTAIDTLLGYYRSARCSEDCLVGQRALALDRQEMHEALARARLGQMEDCAIHLGRGLPPEFRGIADALERHLERSR